MNKVENTPLEKRNKEEQIRTALRLERYARLDKMKELAQRAHTPVKWNARKEHDLHNLR